MNIQCSNINILSVIYSRKMQLCRRSNPASLSTKLKETPSFHVSQNLPGQNGHQYTLFQNGGCLRRSGSSSTRARHRGPRFNVYMFTCGSIIRICLKTVVFPGVRKKFTKRMALKYLSISSLKTKNCSGNG